MSSVFDTILNSHFFLHLRHSQCTQFHFRFSGLKILSWDSRTQKYEFRFPNLKIWEKFSGLKFWGSDLEKIQEKNQKVSKFQKCPKAFPSVKTCLGAIFLKKFFCSVFHGVIESLRKNQKKLKIAKKPKIVSKIVQTCFEHVFWIIFRKKIAPCSMEGRSFGNFQKNQKKIQNSKSAQTCFDYALGQFFRIFVAQCSMQGFSDFLDLRIWVQFSGPKNKSSVFRNNTQQTFFLHSRHSQCTQSHFRFSGPEILRSDSRTEKFEISFQKHYSTDILFAFTPQSMYAIPFQIFWT